MSPSNPYVTQDGPWLTKEGAGGVSSLVCSELEQLEEDPAVSRDMLNDLWGMDEAEVKAYMEQESRKSEVMKELSKVVDPGQGEDIVSLGCIEVLVVNDAAGVVSFAVRSSAISPPPPTSSTSHIAFPSYFSL